MELWYARSAVRRYRMYLEVIPKTTMAAEVIRSMDRAALRAIHMVSRVMDSRINRDISQEDMASQDRDISQEDISRMDMRRSHIASRTFLTKLRYARTKLWVCCLTWGFWC